MPTGYTSNIGNGISFQEFAMDCARAFGACIDLKEEQAGGDLIPERFEPSDYHANKLEEYKEQLSNLGRITLLDAERFAEEDYQKKEKRRLRRLDEIRKLRSSYSSMLAKVIIWEPPTPDHVNLKNFMIQQIEESIRFDCFEESDEKETTKEDGVQWLKRKVDSLKKNITYHATKHQEEIKRTENKNRWIEELRNSLK
jgi:hypothetical protein